MSQALPGQFAALEPFVAQWAQESAAARAQMRDAASPEEAQAFYAAAQPLLEPALAYLDAKPLAEHDASEQRLMCLLLAFAHVAMAIEVQGDAEAEHAKLRGHMRITRSPADVP